MPYHRRTPKTDEFGSWLERSIEHPVFIDRSEGEKAAEERLIYEKAKTEWWNRSLSKFWFTLQVAVPTALFFLLIGMWIGIAFTLN